jgi:Ca2+:H+ antiporter
VSSSAQVALFVTPAIVLLSFLVKPALPLAFRPIEVASMGIAALFVAIVIRDARSKRWEGFMLIGTYVLFVAVVFVVGDR